MVDTSTVEDPLTVLLGPVLDRARKQRQEAGDRRKRARLLRITAGDETTPRARRDAADALARAEEQMADALEEEVDDCALVRLYEAVQMLASFRVPAGLIRGLSVPTHSEPVEVELPPVELRGLAEAWRVDVEVTPLRLELPLEPAHGRGPKVRLWAWDPDQRAGRPVTVTTPPAAEAADAR